MAPAQSKNAISVGATGSGEFSVNYLSAIDTVSCIQVKGREETRWRTSAGGGLRTMGDSELMFWPREDLLNLPDLVLPILVDL